MVRSIVQPAEERVVLPLHHHILFVFLKSLLLLFHRQATEVLGVSFQEALRSTLMLVSDCQLLSLSKIYAILF